MLYLYLDESGDLGFDFITKKPTKYFTITIMAVNGYEDNRRMIKNVKKTLSRKINPRKNRRRLAEELKGYGTTLEVKHFFYQLVKDIDFTLYTMILDKKKVLSKLLDKDRLYNFITNRLLDLIPFEELNNASIELIVDKSKTRPAIEEFNKYIRQQLKARIDPKIPLNIYHWDSRETYGLQACDVFSWGIFQKYEYQEMEWFNIFREKVRSEGMYSP